MIETLDLTGGLQRALEASGETGAADVCDVLRELVNDRDLADGVSAARRLKARVFRIEMANASRWRSVVWLST